MITIIGLLGAVLLVVGLLALSLIVCIVGFDVAERKHRREQRLTDDWLARRAEEEKRD